MDVLPHTLISEGNDENMVVASNILTTVALQIFIKLMQEIILYEAEEIYDGTYIVYYSVVYMPHFHVPPLKSL